MPASGFSPAELAALFTASFAGYTVPVEVDEPAFARMVELYDFDLESSRVATRGGRAIGLANLGARGDSGWIGGTGVVPEERRRGFGALLMRGVHDAARERGLREVTLEVVETNEPALALYDSLGYESVRELEVWALDAEAPDAGARAVPAPTAHALVRGLRRGHEPWQRADEVVDRLLACERLLGLATDGGAAIVRPDAGAVSVEQIAARDASAAAELLCAALRIGRPVRLTNLPAGDPVGDAFRRLGGALRLRQHELRLEL